MQQACNFSCTRRLTLWLAAILVTLLSVTPQAMQAAPGDETLTVNGAATLDSDTDGDGDPVEVDLGGHAQWHLGYENISGGLLSNVKINAALSTGQTYVAGSAQAPPGWTAEFSTNGGSSYVTQEPLSGITHLRFAANLVPPTESGQVTSLLQPLQPVSQGTGGDGWIPILAGNRIYAIFHHMPPNARVLSCIDRTTNRVCTGYPKAIGNYYTSDTPGGGVFFNNRIYFRVQSSTQFGLMCWDSTTDTGCGFTPLANLPSGISTLHERGTGPRAIGQRIFLVSDDHRVHCFDVPIQAICPGYPANSKLIQANVAAYPNGRYSGFMDMEVDGTRIYATVGGGPYGSGFNGVYLHCFDTATAAPCTDWSTHVYENDPNYYGLFFRKDTSGVRNGICLMRNNGAGVPICYGLDGANRTLLSQMPANFTCGSCSYHFSMTGDTEAGSRIIFGGNLNSQIQCWDWTTNGPCQGARYSNGFLYNQSPANYGAVYDGACVITLGDSGLMNTFDPLTGNGPCTVTGAAATTTVAPATFYCDGAAHPTEWQQARVLDANLTANTEFRSFIVTVVDENDNVVAGPSQMVGTNGILDLSGVASTKTRLTAKVTADAVANGSTYPAWSDGVPPKVTLTFNGDPIQACFKTQVVCNNTTPTAISTQATAALSSATDTAQLSVYAQVPACIDTDRDGAFDAVDPDDDNDTVPDSNDAFSLDASESVDTDGDHIGNNADADDDGDGQSDADENACGSNPLDANSKSPDNDGDNSPDCVDTDDDNDGADDDGDNCPSTANADQANFDNDSQGDACDADDDNDGVDDSTEAANGSDPRDSDSDDDLAPDGTDSAPTQKPVLVAHQPENNGQGVAAAGLRALAAVNVADVELNLHGQSSFVVPVVFAPNGPNIASIDFVLDYDESCLTFATTGSNGVPTAVSGLPATHVTTVQPDTATGKLTFLIHPPGNTPPLPLLNGVGTLAQITFGVRNDCVTTDGATKTVLFSFPDVDYGYDDGRGLPNQTGQSSTYLLRFNASPTAISLVDSSNGSTADNTIDENAAAGAVVAYLTSADVDESAPRPGDSHSYSLVSGAGSGDNNAFTLSGDQLKAALSFDFEAKNSYSLRVRSTDQYGLSFEEVLTVLVNDRNEAPTALHLDDNTLAEHVPGDVVGLLTTDDQDVVNPGGVGDIVEALSYTLPAGQGDNDLFEIVGNSLQFQPASSANFEIKNSYSVLVRSTDSANQFIESTFALVVIDSDDNPVAVDDGVTPPLVVLGGNNTVIDVLGNDSDEDGDTLQVTGVGAPTLAGATAAHTAASVSYSAPDQNGQDSFTYTVSDGSDPTDEGRVTVQVVKNDPRGDCNSDGAVNAADFPSLVLEYFDNDTPAWWSIFPAGFHGSPLGCDANANGPTEVEVSGGAGDIICTVLIFFNRGCVSTQAELNVARERTADASLAVAAGLQSAPGQTVNVPLQLGTGGNTIAAATFALSFDAAHFTFDPTDSDGNGVPEAITLNVPASMVKSVSYNVALSRVEVAVFGASLPLPTLRDGVLATVTLQVQNSISVSPAPVNLALVSLGNDNGQTVAVTVTHGNVEIDGVRPASGFTVFMPVIQK